MGISEYNPITGQEDLDIRTNTLELMCGIIYCSAYMFEYIYNLSDRNSTPWYISK